MPGREPGERHGAFSNTNVMIPALETKVTDSTAVYDVFHRRRNIPAHVVFPHASHVDLKHILLDRKSVDKNDAIDRV